MVFEAWKEDGVMASEDDYEISFSNGGWHVLDVRRDRYPVYGLLNCAAAEAWIKVRVREHNGPVYDAAFRQLRIGLVFAIGWHLGRCRVHPPCFGDLWVSPARGD